MSQRPAIRIRIVLRDGVVLGPGKADLLAAIDEHGSIAGAGRSMRMSYQRAWSLVDELNRCFRSPLIASSRGGAGRGGARLTATGREVLAAYRAIERTTAVHGEPQLDALRRLLAQDAPDISR